MKEVRSISIFLVIVLVLLTGTIPASAGSTYMTDDFESYGLNTYPGNYFIMTSPGSGDAQQQVVSFGGSQVFHLIIDEPTTSSTHAVDITPLPNETMVTQSFRAYPMLNGCSVFTQIIIDNQILRVEFRNGQILAYSNSTYTPIGTYTPDDWYDVTIVMDLVNSVFSVDVSGNIPVTGLPTTLTGNSDRILMGALRSFGDAQVYYDDINIAGDANRVANPQTGNRSYDYLSIILVGILFAGIVFVTAKNGLKV